MAAKLTGNIFDAIYSDEQWSPITLRPDAISTTRWDDVARLVRGERGRLLDAGCGSGRLVIALAEQFEQLAGMDISPNRVKLADKALAEHYPQYRGKLQFRTARADEAWPFPDRSFEVIVCCVVMEFVEDVFKMADEMARVCAPGGCAVVTVANVCYTRHVLELMRGKVPRTASPTRDVAYWRDHGWDGGTRRYFSKSTLSDLLRHVGFEPEQWSGAGRFARFRRWNLNFCGAITVRARRV